MGLKSFYFLHIKLWVLKMVFRFIIDNFCIDILIRYLNILFVNAEIQTSTAYCLLFKVEAISSLFLRRSKEGNVPTASQRHHFKVTFCQYYHDQHLFKKRLCQYYYDQHHFKVTFRQHHHQQHFKASFRSNNFL